jgi:hypothetical protein
MPLPIILVVTNPTQDTPPHAAAEDSGFEDEHTGENSSENDEETSENSGIFDAAEEDNASTRSEANSSITSDSDGADPEEDPPASRHHVRSAAEEQQPRAFAPLHVYTHRQSMLRAPPAIHASTTHALPCQQLSRDPSQSPSPPGRPRSPLGESPSPAGGNTDPEEDLRQPVGSYTTLFVVYVPASGVHTRLQKGIKPPKIYKDDTVRYGMLASSDDPCSLTDALADPHWRQAMEEEHGALLQNKTWHLVPSSSNKMCLIANGYIASRNVQMALLTGIKLILLQKVLSKDMELIMKIHLVLLLKQLLSEQF